MATATPDLLAVAAAALLKQRLVPTDPTKLKPGEIVRLLNSTPRGPVTDGRRLAAHREAAGLRIGDGRTVDLFRYAAWLFGRWLDRRPPSSDSASRSAEPPTATVDRPPPAPARGSSSPAYEAKKERERARNAAASESGRDIGALPPPKDPQRRARAVASFQACCEAYFPERFTLAWSPDHLKVIRRMQQAAVAGGLFALAMPRGSGKTSLVEVLCLWAALRGEREFIVLIGASAAAALEMLDALKVELESNDLLAEDFPEVCVPIRRLEGLANRAAGQLHGGERTHIGWTGREIVLPTIAGSTASGVVIRVAGITGRIRGAKFVRHDGRSVRPSLVIVDDPQTDQSARSLTQCEARERILAGAVLGLAGPGEKIAGIMPCTVVRRGDVADTMLDVEKHPEWHGERTKLIYAWPSDEKLWDEYGRLRSESLRAGGDGAEATDFYRENRVTMDAGAEPAWRERFNFDELSAIQHAVNLRIADPAAFASEYQNEPDEEESAEDRSLKAEVLCKRTNGFPRGTIPLGSNHVTAFIDVQGKLMYWLVAAWRDDFSGQVVDYGTWPDQQLSYFSLRTAKRTIAGATKSDSLEASIFAALGVLTEQLLKREWKAEDGAALHIERCLIDAGWGESTDVIYEFCRQSSFASILLPSHGRGIRAGDLPMHEWRKQPGDRPGFHWNIPNTRGKRSLRHADVDVNFWKSFISQRLATKQGAPGALTLFGGKTQDHRLLADHLTSEFPVRTEGRRRVLDEWTQKPNKPDNHWFDCLVGCAVAASMLGCKMFDGAGANVREKRARRKLSDIKR
jgi:hypothetical protein